MLSRSFDKEMGPIMTELDGKAALVTGGSRGIGAGIVRRLARDGASVAFTYISSADRAQEIVKEIGADGGHALAIQADSKDPDAIVAAVQTTVHELGRLDILVSSAGVHVAGPLEEMTPAGIDLSLALHVRAPLLAAQAAARHLPAGGRIITIGSAVAQRVPAPALTLYATSKAALSGMTKGLARDLGNRGITVNLVVPGPTDTSMNPADAPGADFQRMGTALGRYATPDNVAAAVAFLAGEQAQYITGASIAVDGGFTA
jgi:3-oxoacyl-[acyl-carrier protein] reductase